MSGVSLSVMGRYAERALIFVAGGTAVGVAVYLTYPAPTLRRMDRQEARLSSLARQHADLEVVVMKLQAAQSAAAAAGSGPGAAAAPPAPATPVALVPLNGEGGAAGAAAPAR